MCAKVLLSLIFLMLAASANASDWSATNAHITQIWPNSMPDVTYFMIDATPISNCPAGSWIAYTGAGSGVAQDQTTLRANVKAIHNVLLLAFSAGKPVDIYSLGFAQTTCTINSIHLHN
jgi:hypothetical protein